MMSLFEDCGLSYNTDKYILWLGGLVNMPSPSDYSKLFYLMFDTYFEWSVPNDGNRAEDGRDLRRRFMLETSLELPDLLECRMLELFVALAVRMQDGTYDNSLPDQTFKWFWQLLVNVGLDTYTDEWLARYGTDDVFTIFNRLNYRMYDENGQNGGLFPLSNPHEDQRNIEIWYQMMAYLSEILY